MIHQKLKQEMFAKPGFPRQEAQVKNTTLHLNGQNVRLAAKHGRNSKIPGLHLSVKHEKEAVGQRMVSPPPAQESATQSSLQHLDREAKNQPVRHPLKLAPLELPEEVRKAQRQKLRFVQQEAKSASCKQNVKLNEPRTRKVKPCVRQGLVKPAACPSAYAEPPKAQPQKRFSRPQLSPSNPTEKHTDKHLKDVVCQGTPAPLCSKPAPLMLSPRVKAPLSGGREGAFQKPTVQQETWRRRLRLSRAQCLEEDQCNVNLSALTAEEGSLAQLLQGERQRAERAPRRQPNPGIGRKESAASSREHGSVRKSHEEDCRQQFAKFTLDGHSAEGGNSKCALESLKLSDSTWRLKRKKPLTTKHNNAGSLEHL